MQTIRRSIRFSLCLLMAAALPSCGSIAKLFPDKQKEYQFSSDIPPLEIPPDLTATAIDDPAVKKPGNEAASVNYTDYLDEQGNRPEETDTARKSAVAEAAAEPTSETRLAPKDKEAAHIEIHAPFPLAWNQVGKALGRMEVEISDQNRSDKVYYVHFGEQDAAKGDSGGFFSDIAAVFKSSPKVQEYRILLEDRGEETSVYVLDAEGKPQSEGDGYSLLQALHHQLATIDQPK